MRSRSPRTDVYRELRDAIVSGRFHPNERLVEASLTELVGAGRTAVRAALVRLDQEGLVVIEPNRGARVRLVDGREALEIEEVRAALEGLLAWRAAERIGPEALDELERLMADMTDRVRSGDAIGYSELNARFHQLIWAAADHETASRIVAGLKSQSLRFQFQTALRAGRAERSLREHEAIVAALRNRDADGAEVAMREHLAEVLENLRWAIQAHDQSAAWLPA